MSESKRDCVLIFDGTNTFHRNFVVNPTSDSNGNPIGGVIGTIRSVKWMIHDLRPSKVIFVWDGKGGSQRRRGIVEQYKMGRKPRSNREVEETTTDSVANFSWQAHKLRQLLPFLGVTQIEIDNIEADDTIGYLAGYFEGAHKVVVSSDRDMWQLVGPTTSVYWPTKKIYITAENFAENVPVRPENYVLFRAISGKGDTSDNIHGLKGLGEKTILKLFPEFLSEAVSVERLQQLSQQKIGDGKGIKRWYKVILESSELINRNVEVMQLTSPEISAQAGNIIRELASKSPSFNLTGFKIALLNNQIQLTDADMFSTFQEYKIRTENAAH